MCGSVSFSDIFVCFYLVGVGKTRIDPPKVEKG